MNKINVKVLTAAVVSALGLTACGGSGSYSDLGSPASPSAEAPTISSGVITGFGSVFVNGVKYETDSASISVDGRTASEDDLAVGMVVTVQGSVNANGKNGVARHITFNDELEGVVNSTNLAADGTGTLVIMGQSVNVDGTTRFESYVPGVASISQLQAGHIAEVSGYSSGDGSIFATRVELKRASHQGEEIEVKGLVSNLNATTFNIGGLSVDFNGARLEDLPGGALSDGLFVEVKSTQGFTDSGVLIASEVELERQGEKRWDVESGERGEISGRVNSVSASQRFEINGQKIQLMPNTIVEHGAVSDIVQGIHLEAEGYFDDDGVLVAESLELRASAEVEIEAQIEVADTETNVIQVLGKRFQVNNLTLMVDDRDQFGMTPVRYFNIADLAVGDYVEVDAYVDPATGAWVATKLERENHSDNKVSLEGPVTTDASTGRWQVAGVDLDVSRFTTFNPSEGVKVEVEGTYDSGTGMLTVLEVEIENEFGDDD